MQTRTLDDYLESLTARAPAGSDAAVVTSPAGLVRVLLSAIGDGSGGPGTVSWGDILGTLIDQIDLRDALAAKADQSAVTSALAGKQDTLVNQVNIKSINNTTLLGSGDLTVAGDGGGVTVPDASLLGGDGTDLVAVAVGTGLQLSGGTLTATGTAVTGGVVHIGPTPPTDGTPLWWDDSGNPGSGRLYLLVGANWVEASPSIVGQRGPSS